ncbi:MAG: SsrA-binding protein SmpB [Phycisphaerales bacterium]|nr:SsrA-binding protein SmpB [Phycisphaerales bacterium]
MPRPKKNEPKTIENRKARHQYAIEDTIEVGIVLKGSEVKSVRDCQVSLTEGWIRASTNPLDLKLYGVHIAEYPNASPAHQHKPQRTRNLLAHKREIRKLEAFTHQQGRTLIPLKMYFSKNKVKILVGMATGKNKADKRQDMAKKTAKRDMDRAMKRRL